MKILNEILHNVTVINGQVANDTLPEALQPMERRELVAWLDTLESKLLDLRRESHDPAFWRRVVEHLEERAFCRSEARNAERWILIGKRYPTMRPTLLADFFPTADQLQEVSARFISREDLSDVIEHERKKAYAQGWARGNQKHVQDNREGMNDVIEAGRYKLALIDTQDALAKLIQRCNQVVREYDINHFLLNRAIREAEYVLRKHTPGNKTTDEEAHA